MIETIATLGGVLLLAGVCGLLLFVQDIAEFVAVERQRRERDRRRAERREGR